jgi:TonB family protein
VDFPNPSTFMKVIFIFLVVLACTFGKSYAQDPASQTTRVAVPTNENRSASASPYANIVAPSDSVEIKPEVSANFPGGKIGLASFLQRFQRYPDKTKGANVSGDVELSMIVNKKGKFTKIYITKSLHKDLDMEAVRLANVMPPWIPAETRGKKVNTLVSVQIPFKPK